MKLSPLRQSLGYDPCCIALRINAGFRLTYGPAMTCIFQTQARDCRLQIANLESHACATESNAIGSPGKIWYQLYGFCMLWPIVISLYNEVRLYRVVHCIQLPRFGRIQAESNKNRIHTLNWACFLTYHKASIKTSFALKRYANINIDRNELRGNGDLSSTVSSRMISIAVFNINTVTDTSGIFSILHFWKRCVVSAIRKQA